MTMVRGNTAVANDVAPSSDGGRNQGGRQRTRARTNQAKKRATFPMINSKIIVAAETGDLNLLINTIKANLPEMNLVNLSTALHRLAKITSSNSSAQVVLRQHTVLEDSLAAALSALERSQANGAPPQCQALSNITWAMATVQVTNTPLLLLGAQLGCRHIGHFKPFELSATLWAYAKLRDSDPAVPESAQPLFKAASAHLITRAQEFTFRCLVMLSWAFAAFQHFDEALWGCLGSQMLPGLHSASCQEIEQVVWAFGTSGSFPERLSSELASRAMIRVSEFKPQELASLLWGFAAGNCQHDDFTEAAVGVIKVSDVQVNLLGKALCAMASSQAWHHLTKAAMLAFLPKCTKSMEQLTRQEFLSLTVAVAKCFSGCLQDEEDSVPTEAVEFFGAVSTCAMAELPNLSSMALAQIALSTLAVLPNGDDAALIIAIGGEVLGRGLQNLETLVLLLLLRCLPCVPGKDCASAVCILFGEVVQRLEHLNSSELQMLSGTCNRLLVLHREQLTPEEICTCCKILSQAPKAGGHGRQVDMGLHEVLLVGFPETTPNGTTADSAGTLDQAVPSTSKSPPQEVLGPQWTCSVKNTFLELVEPNDFGEVGDAKPLPPPLDIIPATVSSEKLALFRMDYQSFRAGKPVGAKGEVTNSVALDLAMSQAAVEAAAAIASSSDAVAEKPPAKVPGTREAAVVAMPETTAPPPTAQAQTALVSPWPTTSPHVASRVFSGCRPAVQEEQNAPETGVGLHGRLLAPSDCVVKNTFLHIPNDDSDICSSDSDGPAKPLAPPLDIIPPFISEEKLAAYRHGYQKFRSGRAVGAKGEVSSSVALDLAADSEAIANAAASASAASTGSGDVSSPTMRPTQGTHQSGGGRGARRR
eukprot:TRINITY_DN24729_c0_g1_i1.p1 TRINITY_DN24729_c0_g1~~TRINITY_DN24729_c0_g1_i1.p1  ORF type:complete len:874 (+),score=178.78 TRINITY_DN24729_c0_g1_i1:124-2745(+)